MGIFAGIKDESATKSGRYIQPGQHVLAVREIKLFESQSKKGKWFFCVEADVEAYAPDGETEAPYASGSVVSWLVNMEQPSALGNVKGFAMALLPDTPEEDLDETAMEQLVGPDQPAAGIRVKADAVNIKTRAGNDFTKVNWSPATISE